MDTLQNHAQMPLDYAVKRRQTEVVAVLLWLGANAIRPDGYHMSLLSQAAKAEGPRMTELLLKHGISVARSGALHRAAELGALDTMPLLMQHGADVNEPLTQDILPPNNYYMRYVNWTPLHFAASGGQVDAMKLLESNGARTDMKDVNGRTPAQLLEEHKL